MERREYAWKDASGTFTITESDPEIAKFLLCEIWGADPETLELIEPLGGEVL